MMRRRDDPGTMDFIFQPFEPPGELDGLVRQSFYARGRIPYSTDKILPTGLIPLLFTLGNPHRSGNNQEPDRNPEFNHSWLSGFQTTPLYHTPLDGTNVIGLLFEPVGFYTLFGAEMQTLQNQTVDAREVLPGDFMRCVEACLPRASEADAHAEIFEHLLGRTRTPVPEWLMRFYAAICEARGNVDIEGWYESSGYSKRHATGQFRHVVGVTPKVLCRVHRLLALLEAIDPARDVNWTDLAHAYDFYDQAHFNHEFRKLSGLYPSEYLEQRRREYPDLKQGESVAFAPQR